MKKDNKTTLCIASCYNRKFFFNPDYDFIPQAVKTELKAICSSMAEKLHGFFEIGFYQNGDFYIGAFGADDDFDFDEIGAGLEISRIEKEKKELFKSLQLCYAYQKTYKGSK